MSRPSTSHQHQSLANGMARPATVFDESRYEEPSFLSLPSVDNNAWYYPSHGRGSGEDDDDIRYSTAKGNWGRKTTKDARWIRKGKMTAWGPGFEEWEAEERARKRIKLLLPSARELDEPVTLPHLRSPSPPVMAPYPAPNTQHSTYTSIVMDKAVTHTYRSPLLDELEQATNSLIEGEATLRRALGRLWQVMSEDPDGALSREAVVPKREDEEEGEGDDEKERRLARAPDLTPITHKLFLTSYPNHAAPIYDPSQFSHPEVQLENLEKSIAALRELQDDGREYVERLEEIREGLGDTRTQRNAVWDMTRERALKELQDVAYASAL